MNHDGGLFFIGGFMWLFWIVLVIIIVFIIKSLVESNKRGSSSTDENPLVILKKRYARGEIDEDEYKHLRQNLEE